MKVKDLPKDTNLRNILVKIPGSIKIPNYGTAPKREVYIRGWIWDSFFVSLKPDDKRIYPILCDYPNPLEWEVIDPKYIKNKK